MSYTEKESQRLNRLYLLVAATTMLIEIPLSIGTSTFTNSHSSYEIDNKIHLLQTELKRKHLNPALKIQYAKEITRLLKEKE